MFSSYDTAGATSVTTANCGALHALASGDVSIRIHFKDRYVTVLLRNCLHTPDVPINLLSVGVLQHEQVAVRFEPGTLQESPYTDIVFPIDHPVLPGFALRATLFWQLSFLACDFVPVLSLALPAVPSPSALSSPATSTSRHFESKGISVQVNAPYAHAQNGKAERYVRTLEDGGQTLPANSGLPGSFWGEAVLTVQYIRNRVPTSALPDGRTPFEAFYGKKPDLAHLRVWECQCFAAIPKELCTKGGPR